MSEEKEYQCEIWDDGNTKCLTKSEWLESLHKAEIFGEEQTKYFIDMFRMNTQYWIQIRFKEPTKKEFTLGLDKTTIDAVKSAIIEQKRRTETFIKERSHTVNEAIASKEKSKKMTDEFIRIDGILYRRVDEETESPPATEGIASLKAGMKKVDLSAEVALDWKLNVFTRKTDGSEGRVHSLLVKDETGSIKVALWDTHAETVKDVQEGDTIVITNGYVKLGQKKDDTQFIEIHVGKYSNVVLVPQEA